MAKDEGKQAYRVKKKRKKIGFWTKLVVLFALGYFVMTFYQQSVERRELEAQIEDLNRERVEVEARIRALEEIIEKGDSDQSIERLARENLNMKMPGERIYILDSTNALNWNLDERRGRNEEEEEEEEPEENGEE